MRKFRANLNFQIAFGAEGGRPEAANELAMLQCQIEMLITDFKAHIENVSTNLIDVGPMPVAPCPTCELERTAKVAHDSSRAEHNQS